MTRAVLLLCSIMAGVAHADVAARWKRHVEMLASDDFEGRFPGSAGEQKTVDYLVREFNRLGLKPGGDMVDGKRSWLQSVPAIQTPPPTFRHLAIDGPGAPGALGPADGLVVTGTRSSGRHVDIKAAPLVFVGYGMEAPEYGWDDYKDADLTGKVAVLLFGDPVDSNGKRRFPGDTLSRYGSPKLKNQAAVRHGAVAVLMIHEPKVLGYGWTTMANALSQVRLSLVPPPGGPAAAKAGGWLREDLAQRLVAASGSAFGALKARAGERDFRPLLLGGLTLTAQFDVQEQTITTHNVIALLPGRSRPNETVIVGAHWDHQGLGAPDATGSRVYNGAIDNATGVATVLEIARATAAQRGGPERSIAFIGWTMEEPGILGSEYYVAHPIFPLETTVAVINFDAMIPLGRARDFSQNADPSSDLTDLLRALGARQGRTLTLEPHQNLFLRSRSDHAPFVRAGVPAVFYLAGEELVDSGRERSKQYFDEYFSRRYHQQSDDYSPNWDATGIVQDIALLSNFVEVLANQKGWPQWHDGAEYKAVRDKSAGARP